MEIVDKTQKPKSVVYVQMRQYLRDATGKLVFNRTENETVHNADIGAVREALRKGIKGGANGNKGK